MKPNIQSLIALVGALCALSLAPAQAEDNTTTTISGPTVQDNGGVNYLVGDTGTNNYLEVNTGGVLTNALGFTVGNAGAATNNSALVTGANSVVYASDAVIVGNNGKLNTLTIANGGSVFSAGAHTFIGSAGQASNNTVVVTDTNSLWKVVNTSFRVGSAGGNNRLIVTNGGRVICTTANDYISANNASKNCSALVTGPGSAWLMTGDLRVGSDGTGHKLTIANGGTVTNTSAFLGGTITTSSGNQALVTGVGSLWQNGSFFRVGNAGKNNSLIITNGGMVTCTNGAIGTGGGASNNTVLVTGSGSAWISSGALWMGYGGSSNKLTIADGGRVSNADYGSVGTVATSSRNAVLVTGAGSAWLNGGALSIGLGTNALNNNLTIAAGGAVSNSVGAYVGANDGGSGNTVTVTGSGSAWNCGGFGLFVGNTAITTNNVLNVFSGGILTNLTTATLGGVNSALNLGDGTTLAQVMANSVDLSASTAKLNFNAGRLVGTLDGQNLIQGLGSSYVQSGGAEINSQANNVSIPNALLEDGASPGGGLTKLGAGSLALAGVNTYTGATTVSNGTLRVNGSLAAGSAVAVKSGATLGGSGTINGAVTVEAGATIQPGLGGTDTSPLSVNNTVSLAGTTVIALNRTNSPSNAGTLVVSGTLTNGGTLTVVNVGETLQANDSFLVFSAGGTSGSFSTTNLPVLDPGLNWAWAGPGTLSVVTSNSYATTATNVSYTISNGTNLMLTWPGSHLGWYAQSNAVDLADTNYWFDIPGSTAVTNLVIPVNPTQPQVFYRLRLP